MLFYHLTLDLNSADDKVFTPRIPNEKIVTIGEDLSTPRICVSSTIEGCLSSAPWGGSSLEDIILLNDCSQLIKVYEFNSDDIAPENLISPKELYQSDKVRDAEITNEHWVINQNLRSCRSYLIQIKKYNITYPDSIPYSLLKNFNEEEDDYEDIIDGYFSEIIDLEYDIIECNEYTPIIPFNYQTKKNTNCKYAIEKLSNRLYSLINDYWKIHNLEIIEHTDNLIIKGIIDTLRSPTTLNNLINIIDESLEWII